jgi:hypothetical protein
VVCGQNQACCPPTEEDLLGVCVTITNNPDNCGGCGAVSPAANCTNQDRACCGETCVDTDTDAAHCGECGAPCQDGNLCCAGTCIQRDNANCFGCGSNCPEPNDVCCLNQQNQVIGCALTCP